MDDDEHRYHLGRRKQGRRTSISKGGIPEAAPLFQRALAIREEQFGVEHLGVVLVLEKFSVLLRETGQETETNAPYCDVAQVILENTK